MGEGQDGGNIKKEKPMKTILPLTLYILMLTITNTYSLTGEEILAKMDTHREYKSITYTGVMSIYVKDQVRII